MDHFGRTWIAFNVSTIGTVAVGELIWVIIRKKIKDKIVRDKGLKNS